MSAQLKVQRLTKSARLPARATTGAACFDICADDAEWGINAKAYGVDVVPGSSRIFCTGLAVEIPPGHALMIYSRSGHGFNSDVRLANCVGIIDSDYRGGLKVKLTNDGFGSFRVRAGDRIAQCMLVKLPDVELIEVADLSSTERGTGGFGSTGA